MSYIFQKNFTKNLICQKVLLNYRKDNDKRTLLAMTLLFLSLEQVKRGQRAGCTLAGTRQDAELPAEPREAQRQALEQQALISG